MTTAYKTFIRMSVHIEKQHRQKCWRAKEIRDEKKNATAQLIWDQFQISVDGLTDDKSRRREHLRPVFRLHHSPEEAASALGGSSSSSPLGMPSAVDSTSRSRRNSSSEGAGGSQDDVAGPGATAAPVTGAANSVGTSWSFSAKSSMSGLKESCCALECPESGDLA